MALKKLTYEGEAEGFPLWAVMEITALQALAPHPHIVTLQEVATSARGTKENKGLGDVFLVFEYVDSDLAGLLR